MLVMKTVCVISLLFAGCQAHFSFSPSQFQAGKSGETSIKLGHGCSGSPTTMVKINFPASVFNVKAEALSGWTVWYDRIPLNPPVSAGHSKANSTVKTLTYTAATPLADDQYQKFSFSFSLRKTDDIKANLTKYESTYDSKGFRPVVVPVTQICVSGTVEWNEIQDGNTEPEHPAPILYVSESAVTPSTGSAENSTPSNTSDSSSVTAAIVVGAIGLFFGLVGTVLAIILLQKMKA
jgi:periplasmic copper chaperone A